MLVDITSGGDDILNDKIRRKIRWINRVKFLPQLKTLNLTLHVVILAPFAKNLPNNPKAQQVHVEYGDVACRS